MNSTRIAAAAARLIAARLEGRLVSLAEVALESRAEAYAVQDAVLREIGPVGGWKVGAKGPTVEPACAPMPASGLFATPARLAGTSWRLRGIETEIAVRLDRDLPSRATPYSRDEVLAAIGAVLPVIEVVETRLEEFPGGAPGCVLADLNSHGALVLEAALPLAPGMLNYLDDGSLLRVRQSFNGKEVAQTQGGNPAVNLLRLVVWLANHCARRGQALVAGQIVTTGSCTGMLFAPAGAGVRGEIDGVGAVEVQFQD